MPDVLGIGVDFLSASAFRAFASLQHRIQHFAASNFWRAWRLWCLSLFCFFLFLCYVAGMSTFKAYSKFDNLHQLRAAIYFLTGREKFGEKMSLAGIHVPSRISVVEMFSASNSTEPWVLILCPHVLSLFLALISSIKYHTSTIKSLPPAFVIC
jgi:hypothetical protein